MLKLIVHADDFGLSREINEGIKISYQNGILTSCSIMANGIYFDHAVETLKSVPGLDCGIHLTLVELEPVLTKEEVPSLVTNDHKFFASVSQFAWAYFTGRIKPEDIRRELRAQIVRVRDRGVHISHIDSHQHVHIFPGVLGVVIELAQEFQIPYIRLPFEKIYRKTCQVGGFPRMIQLKVLNSFCESVRKYIPHCTDHFFGFLCGGKLNKKNLETIFQCLPKDGICEIMTHPGYNELGNASDKHSYRREDEMNALCDKNIKKFIQEQGIQLTSFKELSETEEVVNV